MSIKNKQTSLTVRIDQEQMDWLDKVSIEDRRTRSELVRMILDYCISEIPHAGYLHLHRKTPLVDELQSLDELKS